MDSLLRPMFDGLLTEDQYFTSTFVLIVSSIILNGLLLRYLSTV
jgi:hypothetical protein